jgi:histidine ammonia-lyase
MASLAVAGAAFAGDYHSITPSAEARTVILTGHDLTVEDVIAVAREGAKIRYSSEAIQHASDGRGLRLEAGAEGMAVYGLNRGGGALREVVTHNDETRRINGMKRGSREGVLPEIEDEDLVRAFLVIRANSVPFEAATPEFMQMIVDMLNKRVTPVMYARGTLGEGDLFLTSNFLATMAGGGDAYYQGVRMKASEALSKAGLKPLSTEPGGGTSNAYADAQAVLMVADGRRRWNGRI